MKYSIFPSKEDSTYIKAVLAIFVLAHHVYQEIPLLEGTLLHTVFLSLGYLSVAAFLFLSGYGLAYNEKKSGDAYLKGLPAKRIAPFYMHILLLNFLYFFLYAFLNRSFDFLGLMNSIFHNYSLIRNGWYLTVSLMAYIVFYYVYKLIKNTVLRLLSVAVFFIVFGVVCIRIFHLGNWWFESNFAFVVGLLWGTLYNSNTKEKSKITYYTSLLCSTVVFCVTFYLVNMKSLGHQFYLFAKCLCGVSFSIALMLVKKILPLKSKVLLYLSKISFEVYVCQGLFLSLFHSNRIYIHNSFLYVVAVAVSTIAFSAGLNIVFKKLDNKLHT